MEKVMKTVDPKKLAIAMAGDEVDIAREISSGRAQAFMVDGCFLVTRIDGTSSGDELVVMCAAGKNVVNAAHVLVEQCKRQNIKSMRFHTQRKGLKRLLKTLPFSEPEYVYRMTIE